MTVKDRMLEFIRDNPGLTSSQIAKKLGKPLASTHNTIYELRQEKRVTVHQEPGFNKGGVHRKGMTYTAKD